MISATDFVEKIAMTPDEYWDSLAQATVIERWYDTTQIYDITEQKTDIEVDSEGNKHFKKFFDILDESVEPWEEPKEAWVSTVSDDLVNTSKVYSDFVEIMFRNLKHKQNYKGQYYKFKPDEEHEETYICYDRMNPIGESHFKCVRCNNVLTWIDNKTKKIITLPCYLGSDISSTNNYVGKDGIVSNARMIILVQANEFTESIVTNQRFMFQHSSAFKVEEVDNYMQEEGTEGQITCVKIYVEYSPILPSDSKELNICDYSDDITLTIESADGYNIKQGGKKQLTATLKLGEEEVTEKPKLKWESNDESVVTIDETGECTAVGAPGATATITCSVESNSIIRNSVTVTIISSTDKPNTIVVSPEKTLLREGESCTFEYHTDPTRIDVRCIASNAAKSCYEFVERDGECDVTVKKASQKPLRLTFSADDCDDVVLEIKLRGLI